MSRRLTLEDCRDYRAFQRFARQNGAEIVPANGAHVKVRRDGHTIAVMTTHGEPGPHARAMLRKALAVLVALLAMAFGLARLVQL